MKEAICPICNSEIKEVHRFGPWFDSEIDTGGYGEDEWLNDSGNEFISSVIACHCKSITADHCVRFLAMNEYDEKLFESENNLFKQALFMDRSEC